MRAEKVAFEFTQHEGDITALDISPDGQILASASADKTIILWNLNDGTIYSILEGHKNWVRDICFSSDQTKLISCGDDSQVIQWNVENLTAIYQIRSNKYGNSWLLSIDYHDDNSSFVFGSLDGVVRIKTNFGGYKLKINKAINKIKFRQKDKHSLSITAATSGGGIIKLDAINMKRTH